MKRITAITLMLLLITGCNSFEFKKTEDSINFKREYESYNDQRNTNNKEYLKVSINERNPFKYLNDQEVVNLLEQGTGIIYFGMPTCPYCRVVINPLIKFAKKNKIETIYYFNPVDIRNENTESYQKIIEKLSDYLPTDNVTQSVDEPGYAHDLKRLLVPDVYFINNGEVINHYAGSISNGKINKKQTKEMIEVYQNVYEDYVGSLSICDESC